MKIELKILNHAKELYKERDLPGYQTAGSAAMDIRCIEDVTLDPGERKSISTGLAIWIGSACPWLVGEFENFDGTGYKSTHSPVKVAGILLPRSGLGTKGLILANTIGLIDVDYQGELKISAWNSAKMADGYSNRVELEVGQRIAQLMFIPVLRPSWELVDEFSNKTLRGEGGLGSTGR